MICDGVEMADIPTELQEARVFKLHLRNNGLHRFPDAKLQGTGMQLREKNVVIGKIERTFYSTLKKKSFKEGFPQGSHQKL